MIRYYYTRYYIKATTTMITKTRPQPTCAPRIFRFWQSAGMEDVTRPWGPINPIRYYYTNPIRHIRGTWCINVYRAINVIFFRWFRNAQTLIILENHVKLSPRKIKRSLFRKYNNINNECKTNSKRVVYLVDDKNKRITLYIYI